MRQICAIERSEDGNLPSFQFLLYDLEKFAAFR